MLLLRAPGLHSPGRWGGAAPFTADVLCDERGGCSTSSGIWVCRCRRGARRGELRVEIGLDGPTAVTWDGDRGGGRSVGGRGEPAPAAAPSVRRGGRREPAGRDAVGATPCCTTCWRGDFPGRSTRLTRGRTGACSAWCRTGLVADLAGGAGARRRVRAREAGTSRGPANAVNAGVPRALAVLLSAGHHRAMPSLEAELRAAVRRATACGWSAPTASAESPACRRGRWTLPSRAG